MNCSNRARIIFITGTDTGVGKTLLTGLLLAHLRQGGIQAFALKPFSSGGRADAQLLHALQERELTLDEINPFHFKAPLTPLVAARRRRVPIRLPAVIRHIQDIALRCSVLLVEGIGGVLVPLGEDYTVLDLIAALHCETVVVSHNKLGTLNHTLLTVRELQRAADDYRAPSRSAFATGAPSIALPARAFATGAQSTASRSNALKVVLMTPQVPDRSCPSNPRILSELLAPTPIFLLPFLGPDLRTARTLKSAANKRRTLLTRLLA